MDTYEYIFMDLDGVDASLLLDDDDQGEFQRGTGTSEIDVLRCMLPVIHECTSEGEDETEGDGEELIAQEALAVACTSDSLIPMPTVTVSQQALVEDIISNEVRVTSDAVDRQASSVVQDYLLYSLMKARNGAYISLSVLHQYLLSLFYSLEELQVTKDVKLCAYESVFLLCDRVKYAIDYLQVDYLLVDHSQTKLLRRYQHTLDWSYDGVTGANLYFLSYMQRKLIDENDMLHFDEEEEKSENLLLDEKEEKEGEKLALTLAGNVTVTDIDTVATTTAMTISKLSAPAWEMSARCSLCQDSSGKGKKFTFSRFRHHCRNCGVSCCIECAVSKRILPHFGLIMPVRVCNECCVLIDCEKERQNLYWRKSRVAAYYKGHMIAYFTPQEDTGIDKFFRLAKGTMTVLKRFFGLHHPFKYVIDTLDICRRYGLQGLSGLVMNQDFVEALETLKVISGMDEQYKISISELTASIYYMLALQRGVRGCDPELEYLQHQPESQSNSSMVTANKDKESEGQEEDKPIVQDGSDGDIQLALSFAPLALIAAYQNDEAEAQRVAYMQGWSTIYASLSEHSESAPEQPSYCLFGSRLNEETPPEAVLCIRGTRTVYDLITDIRVKPCPFPQPDLDIEAVLQRGSMAFHSTCTSSSTTSSSISTSFNSVPGKVSDKTSGESKATLQEEVAERNIKDDWFQLKNSSSAYALGGIGRAAMWLLGQVGPSLKNLHDKGFKIYIVGHSLGGAIAALLAYLLKDSLQNIYAVTYGSPSCVDATISDELARRNLCLSVCMRDDLISRLTPQSVRHLLKQFIFFKDQISKHLEEDWKDVIKRTTSLWSPRYRDAKGTSLNGLVLDYEDTEQLETAAVVGRLDPQVSRAFALPSTSTSTSATSSGTSSDGCQQGEKEESVEDEFIDVRSEFVQLCTKEDEELLTLWLPGRVLHIYAHHGLYKCSEVTRGFEPLRSIHIQSNMFHDHSAANIFEALLQVKSVAAMKREGEGEDTTTFTPFDAQSTCDCCKCDFTWHSTFTGQAASAKERHNCRACGALVCDPCSTQRRPVLRRGLSTPVRVCDRCVFSGEM